MNKNKIYIPGRSTRRSPVTTTLLIAALAVFLNGCYWTSAVKDFQRTGIAPWWCQGTPDLLEAECLTFSAQMDIAVSFAHQYPTLDDFTAAGATSIANPVDTGAAYALPTADFATFDPAQPQALLFTGSLPTSRVVGVMWSMVGTVPAGFSGSRDAWISTGASEWALPAWIIRGYQNHPNVFAASHPCLASGVTLAATTDACYVASHTVPLEVLVTNDDGIGADGIDALVESLYTLPGLDIKIVAPAANQSGQGSNTTPGPETANPATTLSGRAGTAVEGTPADSVQYALRIMKLSPDLVYSGMNAGQNLANIGHGLSGTVGAARQALKDGFDSLATSQGEYTGGVTDYPAGATASLALLEQWRLGLAGAPHMALPNLNIPSCLPGLSPQGTVEEVVGLDLMGRGYFAAPDCLSLSTTFLDDLDAFQAGYISIADMGKIQPPNYP